jgi:hypothetical protein
VHTCTDYEPHYIKWYLIGVLAVLHRLAATCKIGCEFGGVELYKCNHKSFHGLTT